MHLDKKRLPEKVYRFLIELYDKRDTDVFHELITYSDIYYQPIYASQNKRLIFIIDPEIYKKYDNQLDGLTKTIRRKIKQVSDVSFNEIVYKPDWNKFQILDNAIKPILTPWEEINKLQELLINQLKAASTPMEYQNIGNSSRTLMQKLAIIVFDSKKHIAPSEIPLDQGKFKNRLHTFIKTELADKSEKELREFAISSITTTEKSIDLANKLTHDINANNLMAESCVMSTINGVGLIKLINNNKTAHNKELR